MEQEKIDFGKLQLSDIHTLDFNNLELLDHLGLDSITNLLKNGTFEELKNKFINTVLKAAMIDSQKRALLKRIQEVNPSAQKQNIKKNSFKNSQDNDNNDDDDDDDNNDDDNDDDNSNKSDSAEELSDESED